MMANETEQVEEFLCEVKEEERCAEVVRTKFVPVKVMKSLYLMRLVMPTCICIMIHEARLHDATH